MRSEIGGLRTDMDAKIGGLSGDLAALSDKVATMDGKLDVVVRQAHTHTAA
jgi:hypothetical protein